MAEDDLRAGEDVTSIPIDGQEISDGGRLVVAVNTEPGTLDPTFNGTMQMRQVAEPYCEKLYDLDDEGGVVPMLATDMPEFSDDGLTVNISVRTGIQFADGSEFDAEAVAISLRRHFEEPESVRASEMGPIESIEAVDEETVEITYERPFAPVAAIFADRAGMIMSPDALEELGENFGDDPVCVGAFRVVEHVPQTGVTLEADPNYYDADNVYLDEIEFRVITDGSIRTANLQSGDVHIAAPIAAQDMDEIVGDENLNAMQTASLGNHYFQVNIGNQNGIGTDPVQIETPIAENPEIRRAFSMAIDRGALVDSVFDGWYDVACSPIAPNTPFATEASDDCHEYDPEAAMELLEEQGVDIPIDVEMMINNQPENVRFAQALQAQVEQSGFNLSIVPVEGTTLVEAQREGDYETAFQFFSGRIDPQANVNNYLETGAASNFSGYSNDEVDELLQAAAATPDTDERAELYGQAISMIHEDNPIVYLYRMRNLLGLSSDIAGVTYYSDGLVRVSHAAFVEDGD
ncbi:ABC transporter substrate-binding protein [Nesterenkonia muleiensis]|uniref:ABC transporter substrate-binding protein n=1 Tax=Nesterenkonia muleiensis TaxID=2282648 RepID=UPI00130075A8|nr:ABC transporter substrate-binding protein [Nesterenkonia muleiensis]